MCALIEGQSDRPAVGWQVTASGVTGNGTLSAATPVCTSSLYVIDTVLLPSRTLATVPSAAAGGSPIVVCVTPTRSCACKWRCSAAMYLTTELGGQVWNMTVCSGSPRNCTSTGAGIGAGSGCGRQPSGCCRSRVGAGELSAAVDEADAAAHQQELLTVWSRGDKGEQCHMRPCANLHDRHVCRSPRRWLTWRPALRRLRCWRRMQHQGWRRSWLQGWPPDRGSALRPWLPQVRQRPSPALGRCYRQLITARWSLWCDPSARPAPEWQLCTCCRAGACTGACQQCLCPRDQPGLRIWRGAGSSAPHGPGCRQHQRLGSRCARVLGPGSCSTARYTVSRFWRGCHTAQWVQLRGILLSANMAAARRDLALVISLNVWARYIRLGSARWTCNGYRIGHTSGAGALSSGCCAACTVRWFACHGICCEDLVWVWQSQRNEVQGSNLLLPTWRRGPWTLIYLSPRLQYGLEPLPLQYKMAAATHSSCGSCATSRTNFLPGRQSLHKEVSFRMTVTQVLVSLWCLPGAGCNPTTGAAWIARPAHLRCCRSWDSYRHLPQPNR